MRSGGASTPSYSGNSFGDTVPMRIALLSDLHGNDVALEAVLADIGQAQPDRLVCLGDVATNGPQPRDVIARLQRSGCSVVLGNTDADLLNPPPWYAHPDGYDLPESARRIFEISHWCREQLSSDDLAYLRTFEPTIEVSLGDGATLLGFHGSPHAATDVIRATTPDEDLERLLDGFRATVMAGGHTHVPMLRRVAQAMLINPGSVGLPFERYGLAGQVKVLPRAQYAVVIWVEGRLEVDFRSIPIDVDTVIRAARETNMPHADWWAGQWIRG